jgi:hypothetical protein
MDASEVMLESAGKMMVEVLDLQVVLNILYKNGHSLFRDKPFYLFEVEETFEYVNGHGNKTGEFGTRMVQKVMWDDIIYTFSELNEKLKFMVDTDLNKV